MVSGTVGLFSVYNKRQLWKAFKNFCKALFIRSMYCSLTKSEGNDGFSYGFQRSLTTLENELTNRTAISQLEVIEKLFSGSLSIRKSLPIDLDTN